MLRRISFLIVLGVMVAIALGGFAYTFATRPLMLANSPLDFEISSGVGLRGASHQMVQAGIDMPAWQFTWLARLLGYASQIKAGSYEVENGVTPWQLLQKLTRGDMSQAELMLIEGRTFADFRRAVDASPDIRHDSIGLSDGELLMRLGVQSPHPEGLFFPDTYVFAKNSSDMDLYRRAYQSLTRNLKTEWDSRAANLPYQRPYDALIMASIVEKETGNPHDREQIASVFVNRLRIGMRLQTDPSVIYGLKQFDGNLRKRDLEADTPYNTYTRVGLPPTPIALPGQAALHAALHPAPGDNYYFVARGDGSSAFSRTLEEHNRAVVRYQIRGKQ